MPGMVRLKCISEALKKLESGLEFNDAQFAANYGLERYRISTGPQKAIRIHYSLWPVVDQR